MKYSIKLNDILNENLYILQEKTALNEKISEFSDFLAKSKMQKVQNGKTLITLKLNVIETI